MTDKPTHTIDCDNANYGLNKRACVCIPTSWVKEVNGNSTRTPDEVAYFSGPNANYVRCAINSYEDLLGIARQLRDTLHGVLAQGVPMRGSGAHLHCDDLLHRTEIIISEATRGK